MSDIIVVRTPSNYDHSPYGYVTRYYVEDEEHNVVYGPCFSRSEAERVAARHSKRG